MRLFFVPQYPVSNRYQSWWFWRFPEEFRKRGIEVITLGEKYIKSIKDTGGSIAMFSPIRKSIEFETEQIREYMSCGITEDDILFVADISFPGIFCNVLYHNKPRRCFTFCHATSINNKDYFSNFKDSKFRVESAHASIFDKVFVGSKYHQDKLQWNNTVVTYLPNPDHIPTFKDENKIYDIVSASRYSSQKIDDFLEERVESEFNTKIVRKNTSTEEDYYRFLGQSKVLLITSFEDTFGYQIVDAINNGCIPIARNRFAYPELLSKEYLYSNDYELMDLLKKALQGDLPVPELKCKEEVGEFFESLMGEMF